MINSQEETTILNFIKSSCYNKLSKTGDGYYQTFCPYCSDAVRGGNSSHDHGHGNVQIKNMYYKCWRCEESKTLLRFILDLGFSDKEIISKLKSDSRSNITFTKEYNFSNKKDKKIYETYDYFKKNHRNEFQKFLDYIYKRCLDINPLKYGFSPLLKNNKLLIEFYNYNNIPITARYIDDSNIRYIRYSNSDLYFYQDITKILNYNEITITEGIFDSVNTSIYNPDFKGSFFFSINNRNYINNLQNIISRYCMIGQIIVNIIFDKDITVKQNQLYLIKNKLNPEIDLRLFTSKYKDVSELMLTERII